MALGIKLTVDFAFKRVLGSPDHSRVTIHFLNAVLNGNPRIAQVEFLNPEFHASCDTDKRPVLDVRVRDEHGRQLNIEMQSTTAAGLHKRLAYYAARLHATTLNEGIPYSMLNPSIDNIHGADALAKWAYFLQFAHQLTKEDVARRLVEPEFIEAAGVLEMISQTPEERRLYEAREKALRDEMSGRIDARNEGREEGRIEGITEGFALGAVVERVRVWQELLHLTVQSTTELSALTLDELHDLATSLERQWKGVP